jgi:TonB family protein
MAASRLARGVWRPAAIAFFACIAAVPAYAASGDATIVRRVEPEFPREALLAGADKGLVHARLTLDAAGEVTRVQILEANPRRIFDRTVMKTLALWKFSAGADGRAVEVDVEFRR